jgi:hypothetical protein
MHAIKKLSTKSLCSTQIVIDFKKLHESYDFIKPDALNHLSTPKPFAEPPSPQKTLRRKKRMSLFRTSAPPCVTSPSIPDSPSVTLPQRPQSHSYTKPPQSPEYLPLALPAPSPSSHTRSRSQPNATVRLGHPSRPYYTAIRPHMARPTPLIEPTESLSPPSPIPSRPLSLPPPARAASPGVHSLLSATSLFTMPEQEDLSPLSPSSATSLAYNVHPRPFALGGSTSHRSGFSLSGEAELRMALSQAEVGVPSEDQYRYRDMGRTHHGMGVMNKVNKLKRGLKELVLRKI